MSAYKDYLGNSYNETDKSVDPEIIGENFRKSQVTFNIVLFGGTGVGKSTLINAIYGEDVVKAGVGKPITQELKKIKIPDKGLTLWDTRGIESKGYEVSKKQLQDEIIQGFKDPENLEDFPHIALLCINEQSSRIEGRDRDLLEISKNLGIPTIVVFTNMRSTNQGKEFVNEAIEFLNEKHRDIIKDRFIRVNSIEYELVDFDPPITVPKKGLDDLINIIDDTLKEATENAKSNQEKGREEARLNFLRNQRINNKKKLDAMKESAKSCINKASGIAGASGAIPIPGADAPIIVGIQTKMIVEMNNIFGLNRTENTITAIITGILSITGVAQVSRSTVSSILKFIPGVGTLAGGLISGITAAAITKSLGEAYLKLLEYYFDEDSGDLKFPSNVDSILDLFKHYFSK